MAMCDLHIDSRRSWTWPRVAIPGLEEKFFFKTSNLISSCIFYPCLFGDWPILRQLPEEFLFTRDKSVVIIIIIIYIYISSDCKINLDVLQKCMPKSK